MSSAAVVIGALRVKTIINRPLVRLHNSCFCELERKHQFTFKEQVDSRSSVSLAFFVSGEKSSISWSSARRFPRNRLLFTSRDLNRRAFPVDGIVIWRKKIEFSTYSSWFKVFCLGTHYTCALIWMTNCSQISPAIEGSILAWLPFLEFIVLFLLLVFLCFTETDEWTYI